MTDAELRQLVRESVARHLGSSARVPAAAPPSPPPIQVASFEGHRIDHPSHYRYLAVVNVGDACVIEPGVACDHCGYCKSHGH